jgi:hypothetical protein
MPGAGGTTGGIGGGDDGFAQAASRSRRGSRFME